MCSDRCCVLEVCNRILIHVLWYAFFHSKKQIAHNLRLHPHINKHFTHQVLYACHWAWILSWPAFATCFKAFLANKCFCGFALQHQITLSAKVFDHCIYINSLSLFCPLLWLQPAVNSHCHGYIVPQKGNEQVAQIAIFIKTSTSFL